MKLTHYFNTFWIPPTQYQFTFLPMIQVGYYNLEPFETGASWDLYLSWAFWSWHLILSPQGKEQVK